MEFVNYILLAIRSLAAKGRSNGIKILALGLGLAVSLVLLTKVCFEQTYDNFYDGADRIAYLREVVVQNGSEMTYGQTPGGIARRMKEFFPQVEMSTRCTSFASDTKLTLKETQQKATVGWAYMADSCFFQVLDRKCLAGNLVESMDVKGNAVVSATMALRMSKSRNPQQAAEEAIGKVFTLETKENVEFTITGVFEDYPANASVRPDVVVSLASIGMMMYDGSDGILGNDRYKSFVKLINRESIGVINTDMNKFVENYLPVKELKEVGFEINLRAYPYDNFHNEDQSSRNMMLVLALVAVALLITSILNYLLIVLSTTVNRSREMALRKCLGSDTTDMYAMMAAESLVHTVLAAALAIILIVACGGVVEQLSGTAVTDLFAGMPLAIALVVVVIVFLINAIVPAAMYNRIPVATVFRNFVAGKRIWKRVLLSVEFSAVSFLGVLLTIISLQYSKVTNTDLGFECEQTAFVNIDGLQDSQKKTLVNEIRALAEVADATLCSSQPFEGYSGNNLFRPNDESQQFNISDAYYSDGRWMDVLGIKIVRGRGFTEGMQPDQEVIIDTDCEERLKLQTGWDDVIGKEIVVTEHSTSASPLVIRGVMERVTQTLYHDEDFPRQRPMVAFYQNPDQSCRMFRYIIIKYHNLSAEAIAKTNELMKGIVHDRELETIAFKNERLVDFKGTLNIRNSILVGGIVTLLIAIIGLIGYTIDEAKRRSKEIAIRRVSGALFSEIRSMFIKDIMMIAVPSAIVGCAFAGVAASRWQEQFILKAGLPWWVFVLTFVFTIALVGIISDLYVNKIAKSNPAESLKTE
ncbi:MAG: ABC transporter permease [Bacteroidales bacterium]|nr:ABC transporter permease [Bacteroidales bacterium]